MTTVAVFLTVYNHERFLADAVSSVLKQTFDDLALFILDDCSTDRSPDIARDFARQDSRVQFIAGAENIGKARLLNKHLPAATSKYIALLDSDDYWLPDKLEEQVTLLENAPQVGLVYADGILVDSRPPAERATGNGWPANVDGKRFSQIHRRPSQRSGDLFQELLAGNFIFYSSALMHRSCLAGVQFCETIRRSMDWYFFIDMSRQCDFAYIDEPLAAYRIHGNNLQNQVAGSEEMTHPRRFVLETYGAEMSRPVKAHHLKHLGREYQRLGDYKTGLSYLKQSLLLNPFDARLWGYILRGLIGQFEYAAV